MSVTFRLERYRPPETIPSLDGSPDTLALLREHPDEAWLLTVYRAEISVNAAESVQLFRSSVPARITGDRITLYSFDPVPYRIANTPEGAELQLLDDALAESSMFELSGTKKATLRRLSPDVIERMKKQVLTFFR